MIRRVLGLVAYLVVATLVLGYLGVGGYRAGFLWLALALPAVPPRLLTWLAVRRSIRTTGPVVPRRRHHRPRQLPPSSSTGSPRAPPASTTGSTD